MTDEKPDDGLQYYDTPTPSGMSARDVTALVQLFVSMLQEVKQDLLTALEANSKGAQERWLKHEDEHHNLNARLEQHIAEAQERWDCEDKEEQRFDARVEPVKAGFHWLANNWKNVLLLIIGILAVLGFSSDTLEKLLP